MSAPIPQPETMSESCVACLSVAWEESGELATLTLLRTLHVGVSVEQVVGDLCDTHRRRVVRELEIVR